MSPRVTTAPVYMFARTQSSPSVIDVSPKPTTQKRSKMNVTPSPPSLFDTAAGHLNTNTTTTTHNKYELTPVTRNTSDCVETDVSTDQSDINIASLSVPEATSLRGSSSSSSSRGANGIPSNTGRMSIRPRNNLTHIRQTQHSRPISPPSLATFRASSVDSGMPAGADTSSSSDISRPRTTTNDGSFFPVMAASTLSRSEDTSDGEYTDGDSDFANLNSFGAPPSPLPVTAPPAPPVLLNEATRYPSPLAKVQLDRNCHSFESKNEYRRRCTEPHSPPITNNEDDLQDQEQECLTPDELGKVMVEPYQPSRDASLASFGVAPDDVNDIFLSSQHDHRRAYMSNSSNQQQPITSSMFYLSNDLSDDRSQASIPSIHMARQLSTQSSVYSMYTNPHYDDDEDSLCMITEQQQNHHPTNSNISFPNHPDQNTNPNHVNLVVPSPQAFNFDSTSSSSSLSSTQQPKKQKRKKFQQQAIEWLNTVKADNEIVAEAASSKFLRSTAQTVPKIRIKNNASVGVAPITKDTTAPNTAPSKSGNGGNSMNRDTNVITTVEQEDIEVAPFTTILPFEKKETKATKTGGSTSGAATRQREVMGRNVATFGKNKNASVQKKGGPAIRSSAVFR